MQSSRAATPHAGTLRGDPRANSVVVLAVPGWDDFLAQAPDEVLGRLSDILREPLRVSLPRERQLRLIEVLVEVAEARLTPGRTRRWRERRSVARGRARRHPGRHEPL